MIREEDKTTQFDNPIKSDKQLESHRMAFLNFENKRYDDF